MTFSRGTAFLEETGKFGLAVNELEVKDIRFDAELRNKMPPLMRQFALKLDDGTFRARGDLQIGWTGDPGVPAWCKWKNTLVVLDGNKVKTGIPLEHIYGKLYNVSGESNGVSLELRGILRLDSVSLMGAADHRGRSRRFTSRKEWPASIMYGPLLEGQRAG